MVQFLASCVVVRGLSNKVRKAEGKIEWVAWRQCDHEIGSETIRTSAKVRLCAMGRAAMAAEGFRFSKHKGRGPLEKLLKTAHNQSHSYMSLCPQSGGSIVGCNFQEAC